MVSAMSDHAHLTTLDYEKLGYHVFGALEDYPRGHTRFMMKKKIAEILPILTLQNCHALCGEMDRCVARHPARPGG